RECLDDVVVIGERHLRAILTKYVDYYNGSRTHLSLAKDAPEPRTVRRPSRTSDWVNFKELHAACFSRVPLWQACCCTNTEWRLRKRDRDSNTGSNPVGATIPISLAFSFRV